jgi:hypothetical protein
MSEEAQEALDSELVLVLDRDKKHGTLYPHEQFIAALQQSTLDRVASLDQGSTVREAYKLISHMRTEAGHKAVLKDALRRLERSGSPVDPDAVGEDRRVVACFPSMT